MTGNIQTRENSCQTVRKQQDLPSTLKSKLKKKKKCLHFTFTFYTYIYLHLRLLTPI